ncbi:MAG: TIGR03790 family protein [Deltaproteobacteria bacterium]|nr:TIGR03790 family protein [Deltaproteobacteria bacterium]
MFLSILIIRSITLDYLRARVAFYVAFWLGFVFLTPHVALGLWPDEILVVVNKESASGSDLADYYMKRRNIPRSNLLLVSLPTWDACSREVYEKGLAQPIREFIQSNEQSLDIRCILMTYEIPLRVQAFSMNGAERLEYRAIEKKQTAMEKLMVEKTKRVFRRQKHKKLWRQWTEGFQMIEPSEELAAVDSELTLVLKKAVPLSGWIINPLYVGYHSGKKEYQPSDVMMVARLDGPDPMTVRRMIDDTLFAENKGLQGVAYFDCRYPKLPLQDLSAYEYCDWSLRRAARFVRSQGCLEVVIDRKSGLFPKNSCPQAALYCGWYSLMHYVDAFTWVRGAVAYHIASGECLTLRGHGNGWCKMLLQDGVAATIGPVAEPYLQAFPLPETFFRFFFSKHLTLVEAYFLSCPVLSWQMILIGDPLYRPLLEDTQ